MAADPPSSEPSPPRRFAVRPARPADFDGYMAAFEAVAAEGRWLGAEAPVDRDARRATFDRAVAGDRSVLFVAEAGGRIVGSVGATVSGGVVDLGMFVVDGHRGGGIGSALLAAMMGWAREQQAHKVSLAAWPTNHPAIALYASAGFRVEGARRRQYRRRSGALWDSVVMGLVLDEDSPGGPGIRAPLRPSLVVPDGGIRGRAGGHDVVLRPWHRADIEPLVPLLGDPEIRRWLDRIPQPYTAADGEEYVSLTRIGLTAGTQLALAVVADGALAGSVDVRIDEADPGVGEIGYWVAAGVRGRGVGSTAARLLSGYGLASLGLRRVELNAAVANTASRRVAENAGFELEGVRRAWRAVGGVPTDFALYARTADPA